MILDALMWLANFLKDFPLFIITFIYGCYLFYFKVDYNIFCFEHYLELNAKDLLEEKKYQITKDYKEKENVDIRNISLLERIVFLSLFFITTYLFHLHFQESLILNIFYQLISLSLFYIAVVDYKSFWITDNSLKVLAILTFIGLGLNFSQDNTKLLLLSAVLFFTVFSLTSYFFNLGEGDVYLIALLTLLFHPLIVVEGLTIASLIGIVFFVYFYVSIGIKMYKEGKSIDDIKNHLIELKNEYAMPFGQFIILGVLVSFFLNIYLNGFFISPETINNFNLDFIMNFD